MHLFIIFWQLICYCTDVTWIFLRPLPAVAWLCRVYAAGLCPPTEARWARLEALDCREGVSERRKGGRGTETPYSEEPALNVVPGTSVSLSGVSRHRDFIRSLPVHLAKWILGNGVL